MPHDDALTLYMSHRRELVNYANGIVGDAGRAEDVVQEAFLRFKEAASARLLDEPVGYLYRIVRNLALDGRRRKALEERHSAGDIDSMSDSLAEDRPSPEAEIIARQELQRVLAALAELPERTRVAVEMHRFGNCTLNEIAARLGISVSAAQRLVVEGVKYCQRAL